MVSVSDASCSQHIQLLPLKKKKNPLNVFDSTQNIVRGAHCFFFIKKAISLRAEFIGAPR